jgi:hypothetical protein
MKRISKTLAVAACTWFGAMEASGQVAPMIDTPRTRMQPIGAPSAVDRYRNTSEVSNQLRQVSSIGSPVQRVVETSSNFPLNSGQVGNSGLVRQAQFELPSGTLPQGPATSAPGISAPSMSAPSMSAPGITSAPPITSAPGMSMPPMGSVPNSPNTPMPSNAVPVGPARPVGPSVVTENPVPPSQMPLPRNLPRTNDLTPMAPPQLNDGFATLNNSCHVSGPSGYSASMASGCCAPVGYNAPLAPLGYGDATVPPPGLSGAAAQTLPPAPSGNLFPTAPVPNASGANGPGPAGALLTFGQERYPVQVGPGIFGQPTAYVEGQPIRNWLRYLSP